MRLFNSTGDITGFALFSRGGSLRGHTAIVAPAETAMTVLPLFESLEPSKDGRKQPETGS